MFQFESRPGLRPWSGLVSWINALWGLIQALLAAVVITAAAYLWLQ